MDKFEKSLDDVPGSKAPLHKPLWFMNSKELERMESRLRGLAADWQRLQGIGEITCAKELLHILDSKS